MRSTAHLVCKITSVTRTFRTPSGRCSSNIGLRTSVVTMTSGNRVITTECVMQGVIWGLNSRGKLPYSKSIRYLVYYRASLPTKSQLDNAWGVYHAGLPSQLSRCFWKSVFADACDTNCAPTSNRLFLQRLSFQGKLPRWPDSSRKSPPQKQSSSPRPPQQSTLPRIVHSSGNSTCTSFLFST